MENWQTKHNMEQLSQNIGKYFTAYCEFKPGESQVSTLSTPCSECKEETLLLVPLKEVKEHFRDDLKAVMLSSTSNISPQSRHFWFHARCSKCGADSILMRS